MAKKWVLSQKKDYSGVRWTHDMKDFSGFPTPLPTIEHLTAWLVNARLDHVGAKEYRCAPAWRLNGARHEGCVWLWFQNGYGDFALGNLTRRVKFKRGDLVLVPHDTYFSLRYQAPYPGHFYGVYFRANVFSSLDVVKLLGFPARIPHTQEAPFQTSSLVCAREYALKTPGWREAIRAEILKVLLYIIRYYGVRFHPLEYSYANPQFKRLQPVLDLIERQLDNPQLHVKYIADKIGLSPNYLRGLFKIVIKGTPHNFIQRRRIDKACDLLRYGEKPIKAIAQVTGFQDLPSFYRVFQHLVKKTPAQFRDEEMTI